MQHLANELAQRESTNDSLVNKVDFLARETHHIEHAMAVFKRLPQEVRGELLITENGLRRSNNRYCAVFSYGDLKIANRYDKEVIFCEHGVGHFYNYNHPSYAGSLQGRENVILRLSPNQMHAEKERSVLTAPIKIVGVPHADKYFDIRNNFVEKETWKKKEKPTVAISFHWDCHVVPETRSAFNHFKSFLPELAKEFDLIGHAHPRIFRKAKVEYAKHGIRTVKLWDSVMRSADLYVCDNSSTLFEFAYTRRPVVLMNAPEYRKNVEHNGNTRFWRHANMGPNVDNPQDLIYAIYESWYNFENYLPIIDGAVSEVFTYLDGKCGERAAQEITNQIL